MDGDRAGCFTVPPADNSITPATPTEISQNRSPAGSAGENERR